MDIWQGLSLTVVLLLALYGCGTMVRHGVERLLRPQEQRLCLMLTLSGHNEDVEQQVRFAQEWASARRLPLVIADGGMDDETRRIACLLVGEEGGEVLTLCDTQKMPNAPCADGEMCV